MYAVVVRSEIMIPLMDINCLHRVALRSVTYFGVTDAM